MAQVFLALGMLVLLSVDVSSRPEGHPVSSDIDTPADKPSLPADKTSLTDMSADIDSSLKYAYSSLDSPSDPFSEPHSDLVDVSFLDHSSVLDPQTSSDASAPHSEVTSPPADSPSNPTHDLKSDGSDSEVFPTDTNAQTSSGTDTPDSFADTNTTPLSWSPSSEPKREMDPVNLKRVLIEDLKKKILQGLKMADAPTDVLNDTSFSTDVIKMLQEEEKEISRSDQKENLVLHAINRDSNCSRQNGASCRRFVFNITSDMDSVISVHAWFHKRVTSERLVLSAYSSTAKDEPLVILKESLNRTKNESSGGWATFELPKTLALEGKDDYLLCTVEIEGGDICADGDLAPFLVVTKHTEKQLQNKKKRDKRSTGENCTCCAQNFVVTLEEIGYQNFVHQPTSFNIKMCRGTCTESLSSYTINYQQIISSYYKLNKDYPKPKCNFWAPRCEPDSYSPLRMVYKSKDGVLHDREIADVIIDSCRCM